MESSPSLFIASLAFISPTNTPLYLRSYPPSPSTSLTHWHISFVALDYVEDAVAAGKGSTNGKEGYLGLLLVVEDLAVYGYKPSSNITILVSLRLSSQQVPSSSVMTIFHALHLAYLQAISNPFHPQPTNGARDPKAFESSKKFEHRIAEIVEGVNSVGQVAA